MWCHSCHHLESLSFTFIRGGREEREKEEIDWGRRGREGRTEAAKDTQILTYCARSIQPQQLPECQASVLLFLLNSHTSEGLQQARQKHCASNKKPQFQYNHFYAHCNVSSLNWWMETVRRVQINGSMREFDHFNKNNRNGILIPKWLYVSCNIPTTVHYLVRVAAWLLAHLLE